jgi:hypothetical protein
MRAVILVAGLSLALAACDGDSVGEHDDGYTPPTNNVVVIDEECPRADGEPCK